MKHTTAERQDIKKGIVKRVERKKDAMVEAFVQAADTEQRVDDPEASERIAAVVAVDDAVKQMVDELDKEIAWAHRFYTLKSKKGEPDIVFDIVKILDILKELGFYRYDDETNGGQSLYVQIHDGKIRQIHDTKVIRDAFVDYIQDLTDYNCPIDNDATTTQVVTPTMLYRKLLGSINYYLGEDKLERLRPDQPITFMHDTYSTKYFYYRNCIVQVTPGGIVHFPYRDLDTYITLAEQRYGEANGRYIWESSIMDRDFDPDAIGGDFMLFCMLICGGNDAKKSDKMREQYSRRYNSLKSILGYLMHGNFECNLKAILFMDANLDNNSRLTGGTGKGILGKALGHILNRNIGDRKYISEGGKTFNISDERRYSNGDLSTQLVHIEDIKKDFVFDNFLNDVTEYIPIRKMNVDRIMIRSKIMLSSNTPIDIITCADATKRRLVVFELDNYFNASHTPIDEFKRRFFESKWTADDWKQFDAFMIDCAYFYIANKDKVNDKGEVTGIIEPPQINYKRQLLNAKLPEDFVYWFEEKISGAQVAMVYCEFKKKDLYSEFCTKYEAYSNVQLYARAFTKWCKFYLEVMGIPSGEKRSTDDLLILYPDLNDKATKIICR